MDIYQGQRIESLNKFINDLKNILPEKTEINISITPHWPIETNYPTKAEFKVIV